MFFILYFVDFFNLYKYTIKYASILIFRLPGVGWGLVGDCCSFCTLVFQQLYFFSTRYCHQQRHTELRPQLSAALMHVMLKRTKA